MSNQSPGLWPDSDLTAEELIPSSAASDTDDAGPDLGKPPEVEVSVESAESAPPAPSDVSPAAAAPKKPKGSVDKAKPVNAEPASGGEKMSKSRRIREYLEAHPDARNRDVATALEPFGVKAADVANVKTLLKQRSGATEAEAPTADAPPETKVTPKVKRGRKKAGRKASSTSPAVSAQATAKRTASSNKPAGSTEIGLAEVDAAIQFIEQAGGIDRARQIIDLVDRIRQMNIG